jgi:hypothetical protein
MRYLILALIPSLALAGKPVETKPVEVTNKADSASTSTADAKASTTSNVETRSASTSSANGGNANSGDSSASNDLTLNTMVERSAPSIAQGSLYIGDCGGGANGGGSNSNGAGFLGIVWTPADCKRLLAAAAFRSIGMPDAACEMINALSVVKDRYKELKQPPPPCVTKPDPVPPPKVDLSEYATKQELDRAFRKSVQK